jgi:hypothetical protein
MRGGAVVTAFLACAVASAWIVKKLEHRVQNAPTLHVANVYAPPPKASPRQLRLKFIASDIAKNVKRDVAPKGPSRGDTELSRMRLLNLVDQLGQPAGAIVGRESIVVHLTGPRTGVVQGSASFPGGTLTVGGLLKLPGPGRGIVMPIAGGSGAFSGAKGTLYVNRMISAHSEEHTYTISLPGS